MKREWEKLLASVRLRARRLRQKEENGQAKETRAHPIIKLQARTLI